MSLDELRSELADYARRIAAQRLVTGAGGNISARLVETMLISPSGMALEDIAPREFVEVEVRSGKVRGPDGRRPSSELLMHLACYRCRPEINAVVHTHPQCTIALTSSGHDVKPMFAEVVVYLGRRIVHLDYITVTTPELAQAVELHVASHNCLVLRNHGAITVGESLKQAFWRACTLEEAARIQLLGMLVGRPVFLDEAEADRLENLDSEKFRRELLAGLRS